MNTRLSIQSVFAELEDVLLRLDDRQYTMPSAHVFNATIGQHTRHIIELFQCLYDGYDSGIVCYDRRKRDKAIETDRHLAVQYMRTIVVNVDRPDVALSLEVATGDEVPEVVSSNFLRELLYNLEHTIHHMALIRVAINELTDIVVPHTFGVAPSTIKYRETCVQ